MNNLVYLAEAKTADHDGMFGAIVVIDGVGDFPVERLEGLVYALIELWGKLPERIAG
jgi:hypothetical protein